MGIHKIKKGLDLPITGEPRQSIETAPIPSRVAVVAIDYIGMKAKMAVRVGDKVKRGQLLFEDRKTPGVRYTAPGAGVVVAVNRGAKRVLLSVVIELNPNERAGKVTADDEVTYASYTGKDADSLTREELVALLTESGLWTAIRRRPFSKVASPEAKPHSIFVTAIDTNPLAPSVDKIYQGREEDFHRGLACITKLTDGKTYLCKAKGSKISAGPVEGVQAEAFHGKHPAGNVGLHIHMLDPVHRGKVVWHLNYQDVIAIGRFVATGKLNFSQVVSFAGPVVKKPRLLETRQGAFIDEIISGELKSGENRVISGSVLSGRKAMGEVLGYLSRYHHQISALAEDRERVFLGWLGPGTDKFSTIFTHIGRLVNRKFDFTTTTHGSHRDMVPIGMYERVMPMDILPTFLLRALLSGDTDRAIELGCLELDEEDLSLCTFVDPGKVDFGPVLRKNLTQIEKEG
ncbi:MAG: Na(+)-translocating NADH-quinone reductase subunit A [Nannocystaceae bacterium]